MHSAPYETNARLWLLLRIWSGIGLRSFGGGASTQLLIQREFVEQHRLVEAEELGQFWNLCQFTPGINLIALTILIGRKLGGARGIAVSLAGMLVPSAAVTCGLAAGFRVLQHSVVVQAGLRGVIPATAGIMGVVAIKFAAPPFRRAWNEGARSMGNSTAILVVGVVALILLKVPVLVMLPGVALLGVLSFTPARPAPPSPAVASSPEDRRP